MTTSNILHLNFYHCISTTSIIGFIIGKELSFSQKKVKVHHISWNFSDAVGKRYKLLTFPYFSFNIKLFVIILIFMYSTIRGYLMLSFLSLEYWYELNWFWRFTMMGFYCNLVFYCKIKNTYMYLFKHIITYPLAINTCYLNL